MATPSARASMPAPQAMSAGVSPMMTTSAPRGHAAEERLGAARGDRREIGPVGRVGAVGADPEPLGLDAARAELERGALGDVAGEQAEHDAGLGLEPVEQRGDAGHEGRPRRGQLELAGEEADVALADARARASDSRGSGWPAASSISATIWGSVLPSKRIRSNGGRVAAPPRPARPRWRGGRRRR